MATTAWAQLTTAIDPAFTISPVLTAAPSKIIVDGSGRVICVGGDFIEFVNGHAQRGIARFSSSGSLDQTFDCGSGFDSGGAITNIHVQSDGSYVVTGAFTSFNGVARSGFVRVLATGALDSTYAPSLSSPVFSAMDSQDRLYVGSTSTITRLTSLGAIDATFSIYTCPGTILSMDIDSNDKLLLAYDQRIVTGMINSDTIYNDTAAIVRLKADGSNDLTSTFSTSQYDTFQLNYVQAAQVVATSNGQFFLNYSKILHEAYFFSSIIKYNSDGTVDASFNSTLGGQIYVNKSNGTLYAFGTYVSGTLYSYPSPAYPGPVRILADGSVDGTFVVSQSGSYAVVLADGQLMAVVGSNVVKYYLQDYTPTAPTAPTITYVASSKVYVVTGVPITLTATASGTGPLQYSWYHGTTLVSSSKSFTISSPQATDAGSYTVTVTNSVGSATSPVFQVIVEPTAPTIISQPASLPATIGSFPTFTLLATGVAPLNYQWFKDGTPISGATSTQYTVPSVTTASAGNYVCVVTNAYGLATSTAATLTIAPTSWLSNLSIRLNLASGQTLITGFVTTAPKSILLRAAGPALVPYGLNGYTDPTLQLFNSTSQLIAQNDNWDSSLSSLFTQLGAFPFAVGSKDSAVLATVNGPNSAFASGTGAGTMLVELYDADSYVGNRLVNISARSNVGTGPDILIAGFVIAGTGSKQLLIRGIGPALSKYGVTGVLADPQISVFDSNGNVVASNDNWNSSLAATFTQVGAFSLDTGSKDAALLVTLPVGVYSVQLSGVGNTTGQGLIEIYEVWP